MSIKRVAVLALAFTLAGSPLLIKSYFENRAPMTTVATATTSSVPDPAEILKKLLEAQEEETPKVEKPALAKGEHWVPRLKLDTQVNEKSRRKLIEQLAQVTADGAESIVIEMDTPGGIVGEGIEISKAIEESSVPVICVVDGDDASMGFYILQSCNTRLMTDRSRLMAHEPAMSAEISGHPVSWSNALARLRVLADSMAIHEARRLKISLAEFHRRTDNGQDWWMGFEEAKKVGAVDGVIVSVPKMMKALKQGKKIDTI